MKKNIQKWCFFSLLLILAWAGSKIYKTPNQKKGVAAQDFVGYLSNGDSIQLSDYKGKIVLLHFWGSWCAACRKHNKVLVKLYKKYKNVQFENGGQLNIISVAIETNKTHWLKAIKNDGLEWLAHVSDLKRFKDHVAILYGIREIPATFLIDQNGMVVAVNPKEDVIDNWLAKMKVEAVPF